MTTDPRPKRTGAAAPETSVEGADLPRAGRVHHIRVSANDRGARGADHLACSLNVTALGKSGYSGPLAIESFTADNASIARVRVASPAATQDAIAVDGLSFLRSLPPTKGAAVD